MKEIDKAVVCRAPFMAMVAWVCQGTVVAAEEKAGQEVDAAVVAQATAVCQTLRL